MEEGGNDYPPVKKNIMGYNIAVKDWEETFNKLLLYKAMGILK